MFLDLMWRTFVNMTYKQDVAEGQEGREAGLHLPLDSEIRRRLKLEHDRRYGIKNQLGLQALRNIALYKWPNEM